MPTDPKWVAVHLDGCSSFHIMVDPPRNSTLWLDQRCNSAEDTWAVRSLVIVNWIGVFVRRDCWCLTSDHADSLRIPFSAENMLLVAEASPEVMAALLAAVQPFFQQAPRPIARTEPVHSPARWTQQTCLRASWK